MTLGVARLSLWRGGEAPASTGCGWLVGMDLGSDTPGRLPGSGGGGADTRPMADITTLPRPALRPASWRYALRAVVVRCRVRAIMAALPLSVEEVRQLERARSGDMRGLRVRDERGDWVTL